MNSVAEPSNRRGFGATLEFLDKVEKTDYRNGKTSIENSNLESRFQRISFPIQFFSPFYEVFVEKIQALIEAGICPHRLAGQLYSKRFRSKMFDEEIPALVLSMEDLGVGFEICLIPLGLSVVVFVLEVIYAKVKRLVGNYLVAAFVVLAFIKINKRFY